MRNSAVKGVACSPKEAAGDPCSAGMMASNVAVIRSVGTGVLVDSGPATKLSGITQNSSGRADTHGLRLIGGASATVSGSRFDGNTYGLYADQGTSATVTDSGFCGNAANGVLVSSGGTHSFQHCEISGNGTTGGYGASGVRVADSGATVAINWSNLFDNGSSPGNVNLAADPFPAHMINANWNHWGDYGPRSQEDSATVTGITSKQNIPWAMVSPLGGEAVLWDYVLQNHCFIGNDAHLNYGINTEYAHLVYPATSVWNGYKPGVIREGIDGNGELIIEIYDYSNPNDGALAWAMADEQKVKLNKAHMEGKPEPYVVATVAHELGHCLGLDDRYDSASTNDLMYYKAFHYDFIPLTINDKASYDAACKLY
ncbi:MAG: right-handed parallel beta-helix repeat-containing protein [Coriobacteriia bacterium]|nr:right-handed parallel beta-helix repeat-containing protein [Coriobacteriia bacterium]